MANRGAAFARPRDEAVESKEHSELLELLELLNSFV
jgi:hypothetical protein